MRQAYVEGYLKDSQTNPRDPKWWQKVGWTLDWLEVRNLNEVRKLRHDLNCSLLSYLTDEKALDTHWEQAITIQNLVQQGIMPWREIMEAALSRRRIHYMRDQWVAIYGDPNDPVVADKIQKTVDHLTSMTREKRL